MVTATRSAHSVTENPIGTKKAEECSIGFWAAIFFFIQPSFAFSDASGAAAAKKAQAKKVSAVDDDQLTVLGVFGKHCTVVTDGDGADTPPAAAPAAPASATPAAATPATTDSATPPPATPPKTNL